MWIRRDAGATGAPAQCECRVDHDKRKQLYWELQPYLLTRGDHASVAVGWVEGWFFTDKRLRNYKPGLTTYDNNTFMKVWLAQ